MVALGNGVYYFSATAPQFQAWGVDNSDKKVVGEYVDREIRKWDVGAVVWVAFLKQ